MNEYIICYAKTEEILKFVQNRNFNKYTQRQLKVTSMEISIFRKIYNTALWLLLRSCF